MRWVGRSAATALTAALVWAAGMRMGGGADGSAGVAPFFDPADREAAASSSGGKAHLHPGLSTAASGRVRFGDAPPAPPLSVRLSGLPAKVGLEEMSLQVPASQDPRHVGAPHEFYFTRAVYSGYRRGRFGWGSWATDFPKADQQFLIVLQRLVDMDIYERENPVRLDDPNLRRFPFIYALEVGWMDLTEPEVQGLRDYLLAGGFLVIDDFWGTAQWANFEHQMRRVFPEHPIERLSLDHPIFSVFYDIDEVVQVPNVGQGRAGGPTWERDGFVPEVRGIFDDSGRLMAVINWNTDLGDAWEWAEDPYYPLRFSTYAIQMGINMIVYGMSH